MAAILCILYFSSRTGFILFSVAGIALGLFLFLNGFRMLRYKRLILDTPLSKIHSASIGVVEVMGTPIGPHTLAAPVTGDPCFYYRVQAWQWTETDNGKSHVWKSVLDESSYIPFFLEDSTGRVLIDSQGAEMDVHRNFSDQIEASFFNTGDLVPPNVRNFLALRGLVPYEKIKIEERIIQPGFPLFVFGTLGENPSSGSWAPLTHHSGISASKFGFNFSSGPGLSLSFTAANPKTAPHPLDLTPRNSPTFSPTIPPRATQASASPGSMRTAVADNSLAAMRRPDAKPLPSSLATPPEPAFELHPSAAISKGEHGQPFTISFHSQKEVAASLAWKSTMCIWGGPVLAIASLYLLLVLWDSVSL
jgi:E3 Ubiquitin ligase